MLAGESSKDKHGALANSDGVCVSALVHLRLVQDLVLLGQVNARILLGRRTSTGDQDLSRAQGN